MCIRYQKNCEKISHDMTEQPIDVGKAADDKAHKSKTSLIVIPLKGNNQEAKAFTLDAVITVEKSSLDRT